MKDKAEPPRRTHTRDFAVALEYAGQDAIPKVAASGVGELARTIRALAEEHNIPIHEDAALADMLTGIRSGNEISPESYKIVAEVLCFLYQADLEWQKEHPGLSGLLTK